MGKVPTTVESVVVESEGCPEETKDRIIQANHTYKSCFDYYDNACKCIKACECLVDYRQAVQPCINSTIVKEGGVLAEMHATFLEDEAKCQVSDAYKSAPILPGAMVLLICQWFATARLY